MPKVSIIVIVYKVERYLEECIKSIMSQTYRNIEIICVAGDSDTACVQILERLSQLDNRIVLIKEPPKGSAAARNSGLKAVSGDYIAFVDGDDYIDEDMIEVMVNAAKQYDADVSVVGKYYTYVNRIDGNTDNEEFVYNAEGAFETILYQEAFFLHLWDKLYKKKLFDGIEFPVGAVVEDRQIAVKLLSRAATVVYNSASKYYFRVSGDSGSRIEKNLILSLKADFEICDYLAKKYPNLKKASDYFLVYETMSVIQNSVIYGNFSLSHDKENLSYVRKHKKAVLSDKRVSRSVKIKTLMCVYTPHIFAALTRSRRKKFVDSHTEFSIGTDWNSVFKNQGLELS